MDGACRGAFATEHQCSLAGEGRRDHAGNAILSILAGLVLFQLKRCASEFQDSGFSRSSITKQTKRLLILRAVPEPFLDGCNGGLLGV
jgi:hypothetical protein